MSIEFNGVSLGGAMYVYGGDTPRTLVNLDAANYPGSGTTWPDTSGNNNNATLTSVTYSATSGGKMTFNGSSSYATLSSVASTLTTGTSSIELWLNPAASGLMSPIGGGANGGPAGLDLYKNSGSPGLLYYFGNITNETNPFTSGGVSLATGTWYQIVLTFDIGARKVYTNGSQTATDSNTLKAIGISDIGRGGTGLGYYWNGDIAIARVYNYALSPTDVSNSWTASRTRFGL